MRARGDWRAALTLAAALGTSAAFVAPARGADEPPASGPGSALSSPSSQAPSPPGATPAAQGTTSAAQGTTPAAPGATPATQGTTPATDAAAPAAPPASTPATAPAAASRVAAVVPQTPLPKSGFGLDVLGGWQGVYDDEDAAMFLKYQEVPEPFVVPGLFFRLRARDTEFRVDAVDIAEDDAIYRAGAHLPGFFSATLQYDELPHRFSDFAATLYRVSGGDRLLISDSIQQALQAQAFRLESFLRQDALPVEIETNRKTKRVRASVSPLAGLTLAVEGEDEQRSGNMSRSVSTNFGNGADVDEFPDPIDYDTMRVRVSMEYRFGPGWLSAAADVVRFTNGPDRLLVDNPLRFQDAGGISFGNRSAKTFLVSTPPDNEAKDFNVMAGVALPLDMRLTGSFGTGTVDAPAAMRDYTSNSALYTNVFYPPFLPSQTIDSQADTSHYDLSFTGSPLRWLSFRAFARGYEYDNLSPILTFPGYVVADTQVTSVRRRSLPYGWERDGAGVDLRFHPLRDLAVGLGYQRESVDRTFREVATSNEDIIRINADYAFPRWVTIHGDVGRSEREADDYDAKAYLQSFPRGAPPAQSRFHQMKRYDVATRDREEFGVSGVIDFGGGWLFDAESRQRKDDYTESDYGIVDEVWRSNLYGLTMKVNAPCELRAELADEFGSRRVNARYRPVTAGGQVIDAGANDWSDEISNKMHTVSGGLFCRDTDSDRWDFEVWGDSSNDRQTDDAAIAPHGIGDPNGLGHARDHDPIVREIQRYGGRVRFDMSRHTSMHLGAYYEKFFEGDPTQDVMVPTMSGVDPAAFESAYLGVRFEGYHVRVFTVLFNAHW